MDRLVMITQVIDEGDPVFGATLDWVESFSRLADEFHVIALKVGSHDLPGNVHVHSLGKERGCSRPVLLFNLYRHVFRMIGNSDGLFIHQGQIYALLVAPLFRLLGKPVLMWKTHGQIPWTMHLSLPFINRILTADQHTFQIETPKKKITGHGINLNRFQPKKKTPKPFTQERIRFVTVGRISTTKRIQEMLDFFNAALRRYPNQLEFWIIGEPATEEDEDYARKLRQYTHESTQADFIDWKGFVPYGNIPDHLEQCDLFLNFYEPGSIDKAVLEAMALERPILIKNPAFRKMDALEEFPYYSGSLEPEPLLEKLDAWRRLPARDLENYQSQVRRWVEKNHSLNNLTTQIEEIYACLRRSESP